MGKTESQEKMSDHMRGATGQSHARFDDERVDSTPGTPPRQTNPGTQSARNLHGARYGEVLLVAGRLTHLEASVYNTLGLNDCPDDLWRQLNADSIKAEHEARAAVLNGPRYFLMDHISGATVAHEVVSFGPLQMRRMATITLRPRQMLGGVRRKPYTETSVNRSTTYAYHTGREVYELVAPDGVTYIMQSYSLQVDPSLTEDALATLGARLSLPAGWSYRTRWLDREETYSVTGQARVLQDDLQNSYQRTASRSIAG